jgi:hypothetical protein
MRSWTYSEKCGAGNGYAFQVSRLQDFKSFGCYKAPMESLSGETPAMNLNIHPAAEGCQPFATRLCFSLESWRGMPGVDLQRVQGGRYTQG